jgi:hypothetical protein
MVFIVYYVASALLKVHTTTVAYKVSAERLLGIWTVAGHNGVGTEILGSTRAGQPQENARHGMEAGASGAVPT